MDNLEKMRKSALELGRLMMELFERAETMHPDADFSDQRARLATLMQQISEE